jgi:hypothetical protein
VTPSSIDQISLATQNHAPSVCNVNCRPQALEVVGGALKHRQRDRRLSYVARSHLGHPHSLFGQALWRLHVKIGNCAPRVWPLIVCCIGEPRRLVVHLPTPGQTVGGGPVLGECRFYNNNLLCTRQSGKRARHLRGRVFKC